MNMRELESIEKGEQIPEKPDEVAIALRAWLQGSHWLRRGKDEILLSTHVGETFFPAMIAFLPDVAALGFILSTNDIFSASAWIVLLLAQVLSAMMMRRKTWLFILKSALEDASQTSDYIWVKKVNQLAGKARVEQGLFALLMLIPVFARMYLFWWAFGTPPDLSWLPPVILVLGAYAQWKWTGAWLHFMWRVRRPLRMTLRDAKSGQSNAGRTVVILSKGWGEITKENSRARNCPHEYVVPEASSDGNDTEEEAMTQYMLVIKGILTERHIKDLVRGKLKKISNDWKKSLMDIYYQQFNQLFRGEGTNSRKFLTIVYVLIAAGVMQGCSSNQTFTLIVETGTPLQKLPEDLKELYTPYNPSSGPNSYVPGENSTLRSHDCAWIMKPELTWSGGNSSRRKSLVNNWLNEIVLPPCFNSAPNSDNTSPEITGNFYLLDSRPQSRDSIMLNGNMVPVYHEVALLKARIGVDLLAGMDTIKVYYQCNYLEPSPDTLHQIILSSDIVEINHPVRVRYVCNLPMATDGWMWDAGDGRALREYIPDAEWSYGKEGMFTIRALDSSMKSISSIVIVISTPTQTIRKGGGIGIPIEGPLTRDKAPHRNGTPPQFPSDSVFFRAAEKKSIYWVSLGENCTYEVWFSTVIEGKEAGRRTSTNGGRINIDSLPEGEPIRVHVKPNCCGWIGPEYKLGFKVVQGIIKLECIPNKYEKATFNIGC